MSFLRQNDGNHDYVLEMLDGYCDYEEDIESVQVSTDTKQVRPAAIFYKPVAA